MKDFFLKAALLILAVCPIWLTILAFGQEQPVVRTSTIPSTAWKQKLNEKLMQHESRRIQVAELLSTSEILDDAWLSQNFVVDTLQAKSAASTVVTVRFKDAEGRLLRILRLPAKLFIQDLVYTAKKTILRGSRISKDDLKLDWRELSPAVKPVTSIKELENKVVRMTLSEGDVVVESSIERESLVAKGARVKIAVVGKGLQLTAVGQAQENGFKGQTIKVLNVDSKKELLGTVISDKQVEVRL